MKQVKENLSTVTSRAVELMETLRGQITEIQKSEHIVVHVIASPQDFTRIFDLMYKNVEMILLLPSIPASHVWEDFLEMMAQNGVPDANARIHSYC